MNFQFVSMNEIYAQEMINNWKYKNEFSIYDYVNEKDCLLEEENWGIGKFAALNEAGELVGELTIEFFKQVDKTFEDDGYVDYKTVKANPNEVYEMWIGFGLKPSLTGQGIGKEFVSQCFDFAVKFHNYKGDYVRLGVAEFNKRAVKTYERVGFQVFDSVIGEIADKKLDVLWMKKKV